MTNIQSKVPQLRFPEFSGEWSRFKLDELCSDFKSGNGITAESIKKNGLYPVYGGNGLRGFSDEYTHNGEYVLIGRQGALCGNINRISGSAFVSEHAVVVGENKLSSIDWLENKLKAMNLGKYSESSAQPGLAVGRLKSLKTFAPDKKEAIKMSFFHSTVDKKISLLKQKQEKLVLYKKGIMHRLFSQQLRFKNDNGQDFPNWKRVCLGDFITVRKGEAVTEEMPLHSLTIKNGIEPKSARYVRDFLVNDTSEAYKVVLPGDFAMNPMNLRFGAIARHSGDRKVLLSKYYDVFYFNDELDHEFMELYLKSYGMICFYNKMATGTLEEKKRVHFSDLIKFRRLLPCYSEQKRIAGILRIINQKINLTQQQIEQTQAYKQGLIQQMFV